MGVGVRGRDRGRAGSGYGGSGTDTLACGEFVGVTYLVASRLLCSHPAAKQPEACRNVTDAGFTGLGIACAFM